MAIAIGLSGGIDSSFVAFIIKKLKLEPTCFYIKCWQDKKNVKCNNNINLKQCIKITKKLNIELKTVNLSSSYYEVVFKKMIDHYKKSFTPNPDIECNYKIKFGIFIKRIKKKFSRLAFGHYTKKTKNKSHKYRLKLSIDYKKDQTYFLYKIKSSIIKKTIFPIGYFTKREIVFAVDFFNFPNRKNKSTKGLCFIEPKNFQHFINIFIKSKSEVLTKNSKPIKINKQPSYYTIGQKLKTIGLKYKTYIYKKTKRNLFVSKDINNPIFFNKMGTISSNNVNCININHKRLYTVKINSTSNLIKCFLIKKIKNNGIKIIFLYPTKKIAKKQSIVIFYKKICLGGGELN